MTRAPAAVPWMFLAIALVACAVLVAQEFSR